MKKLQAGTDISTDIKALNAKDEVKTGLTRFGGNIDPTLAKQIFSLPKTEGQKISSTVFAHENGDVSVVVLNKVDQTTVANDHLTQGLTQQLQKLQQDAAYRAVLTELKQKATITYGANSAKETAE